MMRPALSRNALNHRRAQLSSNISYVNWTIFTAIDLFVGAFLLDLMSTTVPPEKLPRLRNARNITLTLFGISMMVLLVQIARRHGWIGR